MNLTWYSRINIIWICMLEETSLLFIPIKWSVIYYTHILPFTSYCYLFYVKVILLFNNLNILNPTSYIINIIWIGIALSHYCNRSVTKQTLTVTSNVGLITQQHWLVDTKNKTNSFIFVYGLGGSSSSKRLTCPVLSSTKPIMVIQI